MMQIRGSAQHPLRILTNVLDVQQCLAPCWNVFVQRSQRTSQNPEGFSSTRRRANRVCNLGKHRKIRLLALASGRIRRSGGTEGTGQCSGRGAFLRRNTPARRSRRGGTSFWPRWSGWCRGRGWLNVCGRSTRRANAAGRRSGWSGCCDCTFCSNGTGWPTRPWRTRFTIARPCVALPASICRWRRFRTRRRC